MHANDSLAVRRSPTSPAPTNRRAAAGPAPTLAAALLCAVLAASVDATETERAFRRADANADGRVDISDGVQVLGFLFSGSTVLGCLDAADANDSGAIDLADPVFAFNFLFQGGVAPPAPGTDCGRDPTADALGCDSYPTCGLIAAPRVPQVGRGGFIDVDGAPVFETTIDVANGRPILIETVSSTAGGDPVVHLFGPDGAPLAAADGGGPGAEARLAHTVAKGGTLRIAVRARDAASAGRCDIRIDGKLRHSRVEFGAALLRLDGIAAGETLESVRLPGSSDAPHVCYVLGSDGVGIRWRIQGGGVAGGVSYSLGGGAQTVMFGLLSGAVLERVRVLRNDAGIPGHDPDGDGLGIWLEEALGTCSSLSGFATATIPYWKREILEFRAVERCEKATDNQAEFDDCVERAFEFIAAHARVTFDCSQAADPRDTDGDGIPDGWEVLGRNDPSFPQPLPAWGADPRHKDLFIEVDFMQRKAVETEVMMMPAVARQFASFYQDEVGDAIALRYAYRAATLVNPDRLPGIETHLDNGVAPARPEDATTYGNWGGHNVVPPVQKPDGSFTGADFTQAWKTHMHPARRGIFRYALPYSTGGGSVPLNSFAFAAGIDNAWILAHESGHAQGLGHSGTPGVGADVNCKPNYPSLLNYAFNDGRVGFSDGLSTPSLNNAAVLEWQAVPPSNKVYLDVLESKFEYLVDRAAGHVDWNRDGVFAGPGVKVRAYANFDPGNSCEYTRQNQTRVPNAASIKAPALARLDGKLYVFYSVLGVLRYNRSSSAWDCPQPSAEPCGEWEGHEDLYMDAQGGVDAERVLGWNNRAEILVVSIDGQGRLWETWLAHDARGNAIWPNAVEIPGSSVATGEPSIAAVGWCDLMLSYRGADGKIRTRRRTCAGGWEAEEIARTSTGAELVMWEHASPALVRAFLPWRQGQAAIYGVFASSSGHVGIWGYDPSTRRWQDAGVLESTPGHRVEGRPGVAWVSATSRTEQPGRLYIAYVNYDMSTTRSFRERVRNVRLLQSYVRSTRQADGSLVQREVVGLASEFDNVWNYAFGIDLLFDRGIDTNLRAAQTSAINKPEVWATIWFRPKADGFNDATYVNSNDWEVLRVNLCRNVVNPGNLVSNPIQCPFQTWGTLFRGGFGEHYDADHEDGESPYLFEDPLLEADPSDLGPGVIQPPFRQPPTRGDPPIVIGR